MVESIAIIVLQVQQQQDFIKPALCPWTTNIGSICSAHFHILIGRLFNKHPYRTEIHQKPMLTPTRIFCVDWWCLFSPLLLVRFKKNLKPAENRHRLESAGLNTEGWQQLSMTKLNTIYPGIPIQLCTSFYESQCVYESCTFAEVFLGGGELIYHLNS